MLHGAHSSRKRQTHGKPLSPQGETGPGSSEPKVQAMSSANAASSGDSDDPDENDLVSLGIIPVQSFNKNTQRSVVINALIENGAQYCFLSTWAA